MNTSKTSDILVELRTQIVKVLKLL